MASSTTPETTPRTRRRARHIYDNYYIGPARDQNILEIWAYTDKISYFPGETIKLHSNTTAEFWDIEIARDGATYEIVYTAEGLTGKHYKTPQDCSVNGCDWPVSLEIKIEENWKSGGYLFTLKGHRDGETVEEHHLVIIKASKNSPKSKLLLLCATGTWISYNCWGGSNAYEGITGPEKNQFSPCLSTQRPWTRGFCKLPKGAPRPLLEVPSVPDAMVRYPYMEWAYAYGYSKKYASAGWASYERHFAIWAEEQGYELDIATLHDLDLSSEILTNYKCVAFVGHDEYWSNRMRDHLDQWVDQGGKVARFAGNFLWQIRLEDEGKKQICYKHRAQKEDPIMSTDQPHLMTGLWDLSPVNRPSPETFGANALKGVYTGLGNCIGRGSGGYTIYRPEHWAFENCNIGFGDILGGKSRIFGYEVDGLEYEIRDDLPYPTGEDGAHQDIEILGMGFATMTEADHKIWGEEYYISNHDLAIIPEELRKKAIRGNGVMIHWKKGAGEIFNAATCEWIMGLTRKDQQIEQVTRNVLNRFLSSTT
ncbi:N,N-dimethylformamidase beta subunit family domain-containing protein [Curvivirga sp.]|uniref:N,N-dimethylformamidase beta subunit family domain-containing protein n=1 Tax=Curvivirga sp. TaxID=2856848 RepID=UPI003B5B3950